jgi:hypothetical protein
MKLINDFQEITNEEKELIKSVLHKCIDEIICGEHTKRLDITFDKGLSIQWWEPSFIKPSVPNGSFTLTIKVNGGARNDFMY